MDLISPQQREEVLWEGEPQEVRKLELRDGYGMDSELLDAWRAGDPDGFVERAIADHTEHLRQKAAEGRPYRRVRVVSEPLSEYQRMAVNIASSYEQLRWLPRRLASSLLLPVNDCLVLDSLVVFNVLDGSDNRAEILLSRDPDLVAAVNTAFEEAWALAIPNGEYKPA
ncbi:DUF6879 family protein [Actinomadura rubrisoli]|uniref:DUF6879 domain-containing protein n=1 Tax=Actinomadura rubrisoli TaxID=2530368 RepID=A0A4R4ZX88_9ACTN|nr:DUF6879 family protein [Actinomadura rubrisoli]TDD63861.1 hypothetical protein E1298_43025 [Actinomadura rubrisoli]